MHSGFAALREHCPMDLLARAPMATLPDAVGAEVRRIVALWRDCRRRLRGVGAAAVRRLHGGGRHVRPRRHPLSHLSSRPCPYGDDGTAQAYVDALFALPAMAEWEAGRAPGGQGLRLRPRNSRHAQG